jgi:hypothetical protein
MIQIKGYIDITSYKIDKDGTVKSGPLYDYQGAKYQVRRIDVDVIHVPLSGPKEPLTGDYHIWLEPVK